MEKEKVIYKVRPSRRAFYIYYLLALPFLVAGTAVASGFLEVPDLWGFSLRTNLSMILFIVVLLIIVIAELKRLSLQYILTNDRVLKRAGIFDKRIFYMPYHKIEKIELHQLWYERLLGIGTVIVDTGEDIIELGGLGKPEIMEELVYREAFGKKPMSFRG